MIETLFNRDIAKLNYQDIALSHFLGHYINIEEDDVKEDAIVLENENAKHLFIPNRGKEPTFTVEVTFHDDREPVEAILPMTVDYLMRIIYGVDPYFRSVEFAKVYIDAMKHYFHERQVKHPPLLSDYKSVLKYLYLHPKKVRLEAYPLKHGSKFIEVFDPLLSSGDWVEPAVFLQELAYNYWELANENTLTLLDLTEEERVTPLEITLQTSDEIKCIRNRYMYALILSYMLRKVKPMEVLKERGLSEDLATLHQVIYESAYYAPEVNFVEKEVMKRLKALGDVAFYNPEFLTFFSDHRTSNLTLPRKTTSKGSVVEFVFKERGYLNPECDFIEVWITLPQGGSPIRFMMEELDLYSHGYSNYQHFLPDVEEELREDAWKTFQLFLKTSPLILKDKHAPVDPFYVGPVLIYLYLIYKMTKTPI